MAGEHVEHVERRLKESKQALRGLGYVLDSAWKTMDMDVHTFEYWEGESNRYLDDTGY